MWNWIINNREWIFSGIGIAVPVAIAGWIFSSKKSKQVQRSGNNSTNIQIGGNITVNPKKYDK